MKYIALVIAGAIAAAICLMIALVVLALVVWAVAGALDLIARLGQRPEAPESEPRAA